MRGLRSRRVRDGEVTAVEIVNLVLTSSAALRILRWLFGSLSAGQEGLAL
jgi:hypothetical protein